MPLIGLPGVLGRDPAHHFLDRGSLQGTPTKRRVSKRHVSKRLVSKRPVLKRQVYLTSGLQNVRFQNVWFQNVQFLNLIYLLNKKYLSLSLINSHYGDK